MRTAAVPYPKRVRQVWPPYLGPSNVPSHAEQQSTLTKVFRQMHNHCQMAQTPIVRSSVTQQSTFLVEVLGQMYLNLAKFLTVRSAVQLCRALPRGLFGDSCEFVSRAQLVGRLGAAMEVLSNQGFISNGPADCQCKNCEYNQLDTNTSQRWLCSFTNLQLRDLRSIEMATGHGPVAIDMQSLSTATMDCKFLTFISLMGHKIYYPNQANSLAEIVARNDGLETFALVCGSLQWVNANLITNVLPFGLRCLKLHRNSLDNVQNLHRLRALEILQLNDNFLGHIFVNELLSTSAFPALRSLDLSGNPIGNDGAAILARALNSLPSLHMLFLDNTNIEDEGAALLADQLLTAYKLGHLHLANNRGIGAVGQARLVRACENRSQICWTCWDYACLTDAV